MKQTNTEINNTNKRDAKMNKEVAHLRKQDERINIELNISYVVIVDSDYIICLHAPNIGIKANMSKSDKIKRSEHDVTSFSESSQKQMVHLPKRMYENFLFS